MATTITKEEFETLPDSLKTTFKADGDNFTLIEEDVTGLKNKAAELLAEQKKLKAAMANYDGIDPEEYKALKAAAEKAEDDRLKASGDIDAIKAQYEERVKTEVAKVQTAFEQQLSENAAILNRLHFEGLHSTLIGKGADPDSVELLAEHLLPQTDFIRTDAGFVIRKKGGIGDEAEFDMMIDGLKEQKKTVRFFQPTVSPGSGASGSDGHSNGNGKTITRAQYEANPMQYAKQLASKELAVTD